MYTEKKQEAFKTILQSGHPLNPLFNFNRNINEIMTIGKFEVSTGAARRSAFGADAVYHFENKQFGSSNKRVARVTLVQGNLFQ